MLSVIFICQQRWWNHDFWSVAQKPHPPPLLFFSYVSPSHLHPHCFNNLSVGYSIFMIWRGCDWSIVPTCFVNQQPSRVGPEAMRPSGFGKRGCIQKIDASAGHCTCGYMCLWLHWCSASAAVGWMSQPRSRWSIPTVRSADTRYATLYMTAGEGFEPNQQFFPMGACH